MTTIEQNKPDPPGEPEEEEKKQSTWKILGLFALFGFLVIVCTILTYFVLVPLAEPLFISQTTATPTTPSDEPPAPAPTEEPAPTERTSACTQTGALDFLVLGVDAPYTDEPKGADAIRLVRLDFSNSEVTVVAVPRDLWVSTPVLNDLNIQSERLGLTYYYAKENAPNETDEVVHATSAVAQTLYDNFGFIPNHYVTVHISNFPVIIDAIDGVELTIPQQFFSVNYIFAPGQQVLNGDQALEYASNMLIDTEWDRFNRQELVLNAIMEKVTSPQILLSIPDLIFEFDDTITTDLSVLTIMDLSCLLDDVSMDAVNYVEIDQSLVTKDADSAVLFPDVDGIIALLAGIFE